MPHKRALITRPLEDAKRVALLLEERGIEPVIEPLLIIRYLDRKPDLTGIQALLFTSANGVRAFARLEQARHWPVYAVGDQTARLCLEMGFQVVESAKGNITSLIELIGKHHPLNAGPLFHAAGEISSGNLAQELTAKGYQIHRDILYTAEAAAQFSAPTRQRLEQDAFDFLLFFSPRTARIFADLCRHAQITSLRRARSLCLSPAVAAALDPLQFGAQAIAKNPDLPSLLALVDAA